VPVSGRLTVAPYRRGRGSDGRIGSGSGPAAGAGPPRRSDHGRLDDLLDDPAQDLLHQVAPLTVGAAVSTPARCRSQDVSLYYCAARKQVSCPSGPVPAEEMKNPIRQRISPKAAMPTASQGFFPTSV